MPLIIYSARPTVKEIIEHAGYSAFGNKKFLAICKNTKIKLFKKIVGYLLLNIPELGGTNQFWVHREKYFFESEKLMGDISKATNIGAIEVINRSLM